MTVGAKGHVVVPLYVANLTAKVKDFRAAKCCSFSETCAIYCCSVSWKDQKKGMASKQCVYCGERLNREAHRCHVCNSTVAQELSLMVKWVAIVIATSAVLTITAARLLHLF